jgi:NADH-quinone oxidoreductase subunit J
MRHELIFLVTAVVVLIGAAAALSLRNLVHCALCAAAALAGLAAMYLELNAEFVGLAQLLVYVGAVAILIIFTVLLTQGTEIKPGSAAFSATWLTGVTVALLGLACIAGPIVESPGMWTTAAAGVTAPVQKIGEELMTGCVVPLEVTGLLLTAALLGAVVIAMNDNPARKRPSAVTATEREVPEEAGVR